MIYPWFHKPNFVYKLKLELVMSADAAVLFDNKQVQLDGFVTIL